MKSFILLIVCMIAAVLVIGGVAAFSVMNEIGMGIDDIDSSVVEKVMDKVSNVASSGSSGGSSDSYGGSSGSYSGSSDDNGDDSGDIISNIVSEEIKDNVQNGEGSYREVTYKDGGFRQYDTKTGDLIGSSYESDQDQLPSLE